MGPKSPSAPIKVLSPRQQVSKPSSNPFAPLSPEEHPDQILAMIEQGRPLKVYTRKDMLSIAAQCKKQGWIVPSDMTPLMDWFGPTSRPNHNHDDPAIASMSSGNGGGNNPRRGGYGEGFGFGGGIGAGRGLSRGTGVRNIGLRRQPDSGDARALQDGARQNRPQPRSAPIGDDRGHHRFDNRSMRQEGTRPDEWKRGAADSKFAFGRPLEEAEPAWMDDAAADPAIASMDTFVQFQPGEDMIAKHKQAMKERDDRWSGQRPAAPIRPKIFNSADYLIPSKTTPEVLDTPSPDPAPERASGASRFQRFFSPEPKELPPAFSPPLAQSRQGPLRPVMDQHMPSPPPPPPHSPLEETDQASRLMQMLSSSSPAYTHPPPPPPHMMHMAHVPDPIHSANRPETYFQQTPQVSSAPNLLAMLQRGAPPPPLPTYDAYQLPPNAGPPSWAPRPPHQPPQPQQPQSHHSSQPHPSHYPPPHAPQYMAPPPGQWQAIDDQFPRPPDPRQQEILNSLFANLGHR